MGCVYIVTIGVHTFVAAASRSHVALTAMKVYFVLRFASMFKNYCKCDHRINNGGRVSEQNDVVVGEREDGD